ncbi:DNA polymerase-3 subunit epsilon [Microcella putealis]|uniref:DNA polymerase-3 subunit epsilon n=1 Tax=Microcella putealis TaxID=337005 RepID=A0A4Q7LUP7_9MICO|nr:3'-5' exonuclease [Microcella putealis]RZS58875.1 DNA polymerase-3 subunit epsilon [Microcella putealis]TQM23901.1 DNA polymerase-3 subunit epsilon [Microcella putealis]
MSISAPALAVFDLETTGVDVTTARIVTAFVGVLSADGALISSRSWLADPGVEIPAGAAAIHGVTTERARAEGRSASLVVREIVDELAARAADGLPLVVYNAPYDLTLLKHEARRHHAGPFVPPTVVIDPLVIDKAVDRYRKGKRTLEAACAHYGVTLDGAHDASVDAIGAGHVARAIIERYSGELPATLTELHAQQALWHQQQADSFESWMRASKDQNFTADRGWPMRAL